MLHEIACIAATAPCPETPENAAPWRPLQRMLVGQIAHFRFGAILPAHPLTILMVRPGERIFANLFALRLHTFFQPVIRLAHGSRSVPEEPTRTPRSYSHSAARMCAPPNSNSGPISGHSASRLASFRTSVVLTGGAARVAAHPLHIRCKYGPSPRRSIPATSETRDAARNCVSRADAAGRGETRRAGRSCRDHYRQHPAISHARIRSPEIPADSDVRDQVLAASRQRPESTRDMAH